MKQVIYNRDIGNGRSGKEKRGGGVVLQVPDNDHKKNLIKKNEKKT